MKTNSLRGFTVASIAWLVALAVTSQASSHDSPAFNSDAVIPMEQLGTVAGKKYQGDGLSLTPTHDGARLRCDFQRLEGQVTREGLWLSSTADNSSGERFRVMAVAIGRNSDFGFGDIVSRQHVSGLVKVADNVACFSRPGLREEYSVSVDGVRQDFIVEQRPAGEGALRVELDVTGAKAEPIVDGVRLVLDGSGRKLAYNRLRVTDARGQELNAHLKVVDAMRLAVVVDDAAATYPVRIDPTFSDANWVSLGGIPGADNAVFAAVVDDSGNLYVGGSFTVVGDVIASGIAKWNGSTWSTLGSGMNGTVYALAVLGSEVYAGGAFTTAGGTSANYIAKWDGNSWSALGSGMNSNVWVLAVSGSDVYAGGDFTMAGGSAANHIVKWNGGVWSTLGSGTSGTVRALAVSDTNLYVGGFFNMAGGVLANCIAKWDGSSWSALGSGTSNIVRALAVLGSDVYAGGGFAKAGGLTVNYIAKWDGSNWSALGSGLSSVNALAVSGTNLYAGGFFMWAGAVQGNNIAKWDGSSWSALGTGIGGLSNPGLFALAVSATNVYAGGEFTTAGGSAANRIAKWNGSNWSAMGSSRVDGISSIIGDPAVHALAVSDSNVYVGGEFTTAGGSAANYIARWNGSSWSALGLGMNNVVRAIAVVGSDVYAGGDFTRATNGNGVSVTAGRIAKWNGSTWSPLNSGLDGGGNPIVWALAASGSNVYAGGSFTVAGGSVTRHIAKWNGSTWSALGAGLNDNVYALAMSGSNVYVGGSFTTATNGGVAVAVNRIARWDGSAWNALGSGVSSIVSALAVSGSDIYAAGQFNEAGGGAAKFIAKWNGSAWSPLGSGLNVNPFALAAGGGNVYAGGVFTNAGGIAARGIAQWDGNTWSSLGSGIGGQFPSHPRVYALVVSGSDVYAGGLFITAGGKVSPGVAKWAPLAFRANSITVSNEIFQALLTGPDTNCVVVDGTTNFSNWFPVATNTLPFGGAWQLSLPLGTNSHQFFRARFEP